MRKAAFALTAVAGLALIVAGCGKRTAGIPDPVATVNGRAISSEQYIEMLDRAAGQQVLRGLVEQDILLQWAEQEKVAPTDEEINKQIEVLKKQGQYEDKAKTLGEAGVRQQMQVQQAVINLSKKLYKVTDAELQQAYEASKTQFVHGDKKHVAVILENSKDKIDKDAQMLKDGKEFDDVASLSPQSGGNGPIKLWVEDKQTGLPPALVKSVTETEVGKTSAPISITSPNGMTQYAIIKVLDKMAKENRSFQDAKSEVEDIAAIQKIQMDPDFQKKLNDKKKEAKIDISIDNLKSVAAAVNNPPEPSPMMSAPRQAPPPQAPPAKK